MHGGASFPFNSGRNSKCMPGRSLPVNSGEKSKSMQEQVYLSTAKRKANVCRKTITFEQLKQK